MSHFYVLLIGMGVCTFAVRYLPFAFAGKFELNKSIHTALGYIPPAVLVAIVLPDMFVHHGDQLQFSLHNPYLLGGLVTLIAGFLSKNFLLVSAIGIAAFYLFRWWLGM